MFFGSPGYDKADTAVRSQIQVLQADIIQLKVSSLEALQFLAKQKAMLSSRYPERELKIAHMVSINLRPHVIAAWNSHCYKESLITGIEYEESWSKIGYLLVTKQWKQFSLSLHVQEPENFIRES